MGYPRDIDEYTDAELEAELQRRRDALAVGRCSYCGREATTDACRFPARHSQALLQPVDDDLFDMTGTCTRLTEPS